MRRALSQSMRGRHCRNIFTERKHRAGLIAARQLVYPLCFRRQTMNADDRRGHKDIAYIKVRNQSAARAKADKTCDLFACAGFVQRPKIRKTCVNSYIVGFLDYRCFSLHAAKYAEHCSTPIEFTLYNWVAIGEGCGKLCKQLQSRQAARGH